MRQRITDIRINYSALESVRIQIDIYHDAIDEVETSMLELEDLLQEQESEAITELINQMESVKITMTRKKAALQDASSIINEYITRMSALVAETSSVQMVRVDEDQVNRRLNNMRGVIDRSLRGLIHNLVHTPTSLPPANFDSDIREQRRRAMERNFNTLDRLRTATIIPALNRMLNRIQDIADIRTSRLRPFQELDREFRDRAHDHYRTHTDWVTRRRNWWIQLIGVAEGLLRAFAVAATIAFVIAMLPKLAVAGVILVLVVGVAVMADRPREYVPEWLHGVADVADGVAHLARDTVRYGPQVIVDAVTDGVMDQFQTNESVASLVGSVAGGFAGGWAGSKVNVRFNVGSRHIGDIANPLDVITGNVGNSGGVGILGRARSIPINVPVVGVYTGVGAVNVPAAATGAIPGIMFSMGGGSSSSGSGGSSSASDARFPKSDNDFSEIFGVNRKTFHNQIKPDVLRDVRADEGLRRWLRRYGTNPDIGVNPDGFIVLRSTSGSTRGTTIVTDLRIEWFIN